MLTPRLQKLALLAHVTTSVGWLGAVMAFLALAIAGVTSADAQTVRAAYVAMDLITWSVIVPLGIASPLSGVVSSLGTMWGLFRYYWVLVKVVMTVPATIILLVHTQPIGHLAHAASAAALASGDVGALRVQMVAASAAAVIVLVAATVLSVYKPRGRTSFSF
ncbi:MAG: hypothetical protein M3Z65_03500 [Chloroflexota bacterium]|nr:hypothetical protein [Chloroflexota bacterium]